MNPYSPLNHSSLLPIGIVPRNPPSRNMINSSAQKNSSFDISMPKSIGICNGKARSKQHLFSSLPCQGIIPRKRREDEDGAESEKTVCKRRLSHVVGGISANPGKSANICQIETPGCLLYAWIRGYLSRELLVMSHLTRAAEIMHINYDWGICRLY